MNNRYLRLSSTYRNRSAGQNVDRYGKFFIELIAALTGAYDSVGGNGWRLHGCGDGNSAVSTTIDVSVFTNATPYCANGQNWGVFNQNNTISRPGAWYRLREFAAGSATGREIQIQRSTRTNVGDERLNMAGMTVSGYTGTPTANTPYTTATNNQFFFGATAWSGTGVSWAGSISADTQIAGAGTTVWQIWEPASVSPGNVSEFYFAFYESPTQDRGFVGGVLSCQDRPSADSHPFIAGMCNWSNWAGSDNQQFEAGYYLQAPGFVFAWDGSAWRPAGAWSFVTQGSTDVKPPGSGTGFGQTDADGKFQLLPAFISSTTVANSNVTKLKGILNSSVTVMQNSSAAHRFPLVVTDDAGDVWIVLGSLALPWVAGVTPTWGGAMTPVSNFRRWAAPAPAADTGVPVFGALSPAPGAIAYNQTITTSVTDSSGISGVVARVAFADATEAVFNLNPNTATPQYDGASGLAAITNGYNVTVIRDVGWKAGFTLTVEAFDSAGNKASRSGAYTITGSNPAAPDTTAPVIRLISPASLDGIARDKEIEIEIDDGAGTIELLVIFAVYPSILLAEVVFDGGDPSLETAYTITPSVVGGKQRYRVVRAGGWPEAGYLRARAIDTVGNQSS